MPGPVELREVAVRPPAARISDVVARMREIRRVLPRDDGVAAFNDLYLAVTVSVADRARRGAFEDVRFVRWLDVAFANLYFDALRAWVAGRRVPSAWAPLVATRSRPDVLPLQFALAGMNAHINRDLPVALIQTCGARRVELTPRSPQRRDFRLINELLAEVESEVKGRLLAGALSHADVALGSLDDVIAMWKVERAREAAWANARTLWALREQPRLQSEFLRSLDRIVGFAGRGLLRPVVA